MLQNHLPGASRFCHGIGTILTHANPVTVTMTTEGNSFLICPDLKVCGMEPQ